MKLVRESIQDIIRVIEYDDIRNAIMHDDVHHWYMDETINESIVDAWEIEHNIRNAVESIIDELGLHGKCSNIKKYKGYDNDFTIAFILTHNGKKILYGIAYSDEYGINATLEDQKNPYNVIEDCKNIEEAKRVVKGWIDFLLNTDYL